MGQPDQVLQVMSEFYIAEIMLTITVFYFGGGFVEGRIEAKNRGRKTKGD